MAWVEGSKLVYHSSARDSIAMERCRPQSIAEYVSSADSAWLWLTTYLKPSVDEASLVSAIRDGTAIAIADGSFDPFLRRGAAGFCVTTGSGRLGIYAAHATPGNAEDHCAFRSELSGILGTLFLCQGLCQIHAIISGSILVGCDNLLAGQHGIEYQRPPQPSQQHFDLLQAIWHLRQSLPISVAYRHVEGHQRTKYPSRTLSIEAILNENMDGLAKAFLRAYCQGPAPSLGIIMPHEWAVMSRGRKLCRDLKNSLRNDLESTNIETMWKAPKKRKPGLPVRPPKFLLEQIQCMDLAAIAHAWRTSHGNRRRFVSKLGSNQLPVGNYMKNTNFWQTAQCPCCLLPKETGAHLLTCPDPRAQAHRQTALLEFADRLKALKTHSGLAKALLALANHALLGTPLYLHEHAMDLRPMIT